MTEDARLDKYPPESHGSKHTDGTDDIADATAISKGLATPTQITKLDGVEAGATAYTDGDAEVVADAQIVTHASDADAHHAKSHAHDGLDGSGTVAHSATTGQTTDDHHAKSHSHSAASGAGAIATDQIAKFGDGGVTNYAELQTSGKYRAYGTGRFKRVAYVFPTQMSVGGTYTFNANSYQVSTLVVIGTTDRPAMFRSFATGARQYCLAQLALPLDYVAGTDFDVVLACSANGSGNSMMNVGVLGTSDGESYDVAPTYQTLSAVALTGTYKRVSKVFTITGTNYNPGDCLSIVIMRNGLDGGDTLAVAMQLAGMGIRYISDKLGDDV